MLQSGKQSRILLKNMPKEDHQMKENRISELRKNVTAEKFRIAYSAFMEQADKNSVSRKGQGSRTPFGFEGNREFDGANLSQHFGQGAASSTPYINWWVVSIYYLPDTGKIIMGIEEDRYPYLGKMNPDRYTYIGNKATRVAVFYSASKKDVDFFDLYGKFIDVAEEVMELGLR